ncbi:hypothetical protein EDC59_1024 [Pseudodesulfovibrio indicus]|uniref:Uncharacterized protein n=1 Tax=Pseudodesulfovibrio indicus TaxID=1716143 RepID=A0AA94TKT1_9BACT|nr:hypothetical protein EDC59_1024 [Pseudodesulfovibrio indicus]
MKPFSYGLSKKYISNYYELLLVFISTGAVPGIPCLRVRAGEGGSGGG